MKRITSYILTIFLFLFVVACISLAPLLSGEERTPEPSTMPGKIGNSHTIISPNELSLQCPIWGAWRVDKELVMPERIHTIDLSFEDVKDIEVFFDPSYYKIDSEKIENPNYEVQVMETWKCERVYRLDLSIAGVESEYIYLITPVDKDGNIKGEHFATFFYTDDDMLFTNTIGPFLQLVRVTT